MKDQYIIWGRKDSTEKYDDILVSEHAGIKDMKQAKDVVKKLEALVTSLSQLEASYNMANPGDLFSPRPAGGCVPPPHPLAARMCGMIL